MKNVCLVGCENNEDVEFVVWLPLPNFLISEVWGTLLSVEVWRVARPEAGFGDR